MLKSIPTKGFAAAATLALCLMTGLFLSAKSDNPRWKDMYELNEIQSIFHGSATLGDADLMASIWAEDAVFSGGGNVVKGRDNIVDFFKSGAGWGKTANLVPSLKTTIDIHGNTATLRFECVIVFVDGSSPLTTSLSTLPPGSQNPKVEIIQHSNTTIEAVKIHGRWQIQTFTGKGGPMS